MIVIEPPRHTPRRWLQNLVQHLFPRRLTQEEQDRMGEMESRLTLAEGGYVEEVKMLEGREEKGRPS